MKKLVLLFLMTFSPIFMRGDNSKEATENLYKIIIHAARHRQKNDFKAFMDSLANTEQANDILVQLLANQVVSCLNAKKRSASAVDYQYSNLVLAPICSNLIYAQIAINRKLSKKLSLENRDKVL